MDNLAVIITTTIDPRWIWQGWKNIKWTKMSFKPVNINITSSHKTGKVNDKFCFKIGEMSIPTFTKKLM